MPLNLAWCGFVCFAANRSEVSRATSPPMAYPGPQLPQLQQPQRAKQQPNHQQQKQRKAAARQQHVRSVSGPKRPLYHRGPWLLGRLGGVNRSGMMRLPCRRRSGAVGSLQSIRAVLMSTTQLAMGIAPGIPTGQCWVMHRRSAIWVLSGCELFTPCSYKLYFGQSPGHSIGLLCIENRPLGMQDITLQSRKSIQGSRARSVNAPSFDAESCLEIGPIS